MLFQMVDYLETVPMQLKKDPMKTSQIIVNETKDLKTAAGEQKLLKAGRTLLKFGVVGEGAFIGADAGIRLYGQTKKRGFFSCYI